MVMMMLTSVMYLGKQGEWHTPRSERKIWIMMMMLTSAIYLGKQGEGHAPREEDLDGDDDVDFCYLFR